MIFRGDHDGRGTRLLAVIRLNDVGDGGVENRGSLVHLGHFRRDRQPRLFPFGEDDSRLHFVVAFVHHLYRLTFGGILFRERRGVGQVEDAGGDCLGTESRRTGEL